MFIQRLASRLKIVLRSALYRRAFAESRKCFNGCGGARAFICALKNPQTQELADFSCLIEAFSLLQTKKLLGLELENCRGIVGFAGAQDRAWEVVLVGRVGEMLGL